MEEIKTENIIKDPTYKIDLDVDSPEDVAKVLRAAAERYYESAGELESAWQDKKVGRVWTKIAAVLESTADKTEAITKKFL